MTLLSLKTICNRDYFHDVNWPFIFLINIIQQVFIIAYHCTSLVYFMLSYVIYCSISKWHSVLMSSANLTFKTRHVTCVWLREATRPVCNILWAFWHANDSEVNEQARQVSSPWPLWSRLDQITGLVVFLRLQIKVPPVNKEVLLLFGGLWYCWSLCFSPLTSILKKKKKLLGEHLQRCSFEIDPWTTFF